MSEVKREVGGVNFKELPVGEDNSLADEKDADAGLTTNYAKSTNSNHFDTRLYVPNDRVCLIKLKADEAPDRLKNDEKNVKKSDLSMEMCPSVPIKSEEGDETFQEKDQKLLSEGNQLDSLFPGENAVTVKLEKIDETDEIADAICHIPKPPQPLEGELIPSTLYDEIIKSESQCAQYMQSTDMPVFASPMLPPPQVRGQLRFSAANTGRAVTGRLPLTPYPNAAIRNSFAHVTHAQIPEWHLNKTTSCQTPPQAMHVVFSPNSDAQSASSSSFSSFSASNGTTDSSISPAVSDFSSSSPFNVSTYDVSIEGDGIVQNVSEPDCQSLGRFDEPSGMFHYLIPVVNEREDHNVKERKRRSRVSSACSSMRNLIPGMSEKTDKASVFEQAVEYIAFLKSKIGVNFDQIYLDNLCQR